MTRRYQSVVVYRDRWGDLHVKGYVCAATTPKSARIKLVRRVQRIVSRHLAYVLEADLKRWVSRTRLWVCELVLRDGSASIYGAFREFIIEPERRVCRGWLRPGFQHEWTKEPVRSLLRWGIVEDARA